MTDVAHTEQLRVMAEQEKVLARLFIEAGEARTSVQARSTGLDTRAALLASSGAVLIGLLANQSAGGMGAVAIVAAVAALAGIVLGLITLIPHTGPALDLDEARNKLHADVAGFAALLDIYDAKTKAQKSDEESLSRRRVYVLSGYLLLLVAVILTTVLILTR